MRIILADDHALIRETLSLYLTRLADDVTVLEASSFNEAHAEMKNGGGADLVILDLVMPGMKDFAGLITLKDEYPELPVVILSAAVESHQAKRSLELGARGYIPKTIRGPQLIDALKKVLDGERFVPDDLLVDIESQPEVSALTQREREVLVLLTQGHSNRDIAERLGIKEITVKVHLKSVFRKFQVSNRTQAVRKAMDLGLASPG
ncbi:response regulator transcription factor [Magnetospira sp. QH-2]|uniref:response regulator transcription factor n=1 Tax=Magnetospira sp. (strain QH-2) TaxID=1288970 RepID=UPI0003E81B92|nr:response regulator transcription factor [Magnetospira sp. QH-2]CCQ74697.1 putative two component transcriptional regulator, LuxR family [Magnetospira sp. QH-2]